MNLTRFFSLVSATQRYTARAGVIIAAALAPFALAQGVSLTPSAPAAVKPLTVKGSLSIAFSTRLQPGKDGVTDLYTMALNVADSVVLRGTIAHRPFISHAMGDQQGLLTFALDTDVVNPANPAQTRNVGKLFGTVGIDTQNAYHFETGALKVGIVGTGQASSFESRFGGIAYGKPPAATGFAKVTQEAKRIVGSKGAIVLRRYDQMRFENHVLAAGPVKVYPESSVSGVMLYDYDRSLWVLNGLSVVYGIDGRRLQDSLTGTIRWIEAPNRKQSGDGHYEFDVRVNEPPPNESAAFAGASDEASFFASEDTIPALTGTATYKDVMNGNGVPTASAVQIDLKGNRLTKAQLVYLTKLLWLSCVVPFNAE